MDHAFQQEVWSTLPLNEYQRQDLLNNLIAELVMDESSEDVKRDLEETPQKKRKRLSNNPET
jgi:spore germination protein YaaH